MVSDGKDNRARVSGAIVAFSLLLALPSLGASPGSFDVDGSSFFSPPEARQQEIPSYKQSAADKFKMKMFGNKTDGLSQFNRLRSIPSLTPSQRREIVQIFTSAKSKAEPLKAQIQELRQASNNDQGRLMADPDSKEKFMDLRRQVVDLQKQLSDQVNFVLTDEQQRELAAMRKGELTPATFNEPMVGGGGMDAMNEQGRRLLQHAGQ